MRWVCIMGTGIRHEDSMGCCAIETLWTPGLRGLADPVTDERIITIPLWECISSFDVRSLEYPNVDAGNIHALTANFFLDCISTLRE